MSTYRLFNLLIVITLFVVTACAPQAEVMPTATQPPAPSPTVQPTVEASPTPLAPLSLVVVGDSIPYNSSQDCPGCTAFVDLYAEAITAATGQPVNVRNLSEHNSLQIDGLLTELKSDNLRRDALANADIIIVGIAHNDTAMNGYDDLCDGPNADMPDWSKYNAECATASAELFRPKFESVYSQIVELREGKPTIFRTINRYNDWIGWSELPAEGIEPTRLVIDAWNKMICEAAEKNGFVCADIYHEFNGADGLKPSGDLLAADYTHPSAKGNEVIAQVLIDLGFAPIAP